MSSLAKLNPNHKPAFDGIKITSDLLIKLYKEVKFCRAYLFGSASIGENTEDSDLDILIVINEQYQIKFVYDIVCQGHFSSVAVDWIVKTEKEFEEQKNRGGVCFIAFNYGKEFCIDDIK